jgi:hypothetical protein
MARRKEGQGIQRREISFHSFRTFVKTTLATQINSDFSEFFLGHSYSTYWSMKEPERRELYLKCMPYLTFLDYTTVESIGKDYLSKLAERDKEIEELKHTMGNLVDMVDEMEKKNQKLKRS